MGMSDAHKAALAEGRRQGRAIRAYLEALGGRRRGRPVTPETVQQTIARIEETLESEPDLLARVELIQARRDAEARLGELETRPDFETLEEGFVKHAKPYSERKGITYVAWRAAGVPASVVKRAGISRSR